MADLSFEDLVKYSNSPVHFAVARHDYMALRRIISTLPHLAQPGEILTESDSVAEEQRADALAAVIDRRDVPGRETPLHLAVRLRDPIAAEMLMAAGADWSFQNERGWSALQEAVCAREDAIAKIILKYYRPMAWAKWCRRLPRIIGTMQRMRDFYLELTFHFESSVIPFIGRIAPSDTYKIWKRGSNLRADMTLAGFDGLKMQRADQTFLFLGEGSDDGKLPPGYLCLLNHKSKEIMNALEGASSQPAEADISEEVAAMCQTNMYRPAVDVTQAELIPHMTWRQNEKTEMVGPWKAKVYDMHHVMVSIKSRKVPGAIMTDEEIFGMAEVDREEGDLDEDLIELLTEVERQELEAAFQSENMGAADEGCNLEKPQFSNSIKISRKVDTFRDEIHLSSASRVVENESTESMLSSKEERKGSFTPVRNAKRECDSKIAPHRSSLCISGKVSNLLGDNPQHDGDPFRNDLKFERRRRSVDSRLSNFRASGELAYRKERDGRKSVSKENLQRRRPAPSSSESEYRKGLHPVLWLTPHFPLKTEELLPLLDILANRVKAVRRLRELLTTQMPANMFPVKVAIPVVPTIRVIVTFTKFEELSSNVELAIPPTSPCVRDGRDKTSSSWFSWIRGSATKVVGMSDRVQEHSKSIDPFIIPSDYVWTSMDARRRRAKEKRSRSKKAKKLSGRFQE